MIKKYLIGLCSALLFPTLIFAQAPKADAVQKVYHFVFFDQGRSNISPEEWTSLENLVWDIKSSGVTVNMIEVHGYADAVSEKKYPKLSYDRSAVVREMITGFGFSPNSVYTTGGNANAKEDATAKKRATVCVHYTGTLKRTQPKPVAEFDPNFDKKIMADPAQPEAKNTPVPTPPAKTKPISKSPAPVKPVAAPAKADAPKPADWK